ncbi:alpha/beta hydrolase [Pantoea sp. GM01]|uniref:alpha/beta hydrolase n=1 Tax=Pantoea sp. GM01 TaxID=1144320 RepID=UPI000271436D|nr:alpha/beta hydrolase [Pantoea sp. GM01]EJL88154.1 esterase/lipase [Pantoea sp. GM01]
MNRRHFLSCLSLSALAMRSGMTFAAATQVTTKILPLWPDLPPGGGGPSGNVVISDKGAQRNIVQPTLTLLTPAKPNGRAVLVAAGGGYTRIEMGKEAWPAAAWLTARGYTAYVLSYRLPHEGWKDGAIVSLQDAQRALRMVRQREKHVSVLGLSAGGHLLGMAVTRADFRSYRATDALDNQPATADRAALIYPIITLEPPYTHTSTHKILVGKKASTSEDARWSVQEFVNPQSPPFFLVQAEDDPISDPHNTLIMADACQQQHVPVEMHRYSSGGHGFGMGRPGTPTVAWPELYEKWLRR